MQALTQAMTPKELTEKNGQAGVLLGMQEQLSKLCAPGVLGFYDCFEVTEIVAFHDNHPPLNVFSLLVAEEGEQSESASTLVWLTPRTMISVPGLKEWKFGIARYYLTLSALLTSLERYERTKVWCPLGKPLEIGNLQSIPQQFTPADSYVELAWNRILKNNFWNGSYLLELADPEKLKLRFFFDRPDLLQALSKSINEYVPIGIAGLSDRLGNIIVQLPVTALIAEFRKTDQDSFHVEVAWHPKAQTRTLRATCEIVSDGLVSAYATAEIENGSANLPIGHSQSSHRGLLWDDANGVILAATSPSSFIQSLGFNMRVNKHEPRVFSVPQSDGQLQSERIDVMGRGQTSTIGKPASDGNGGWTNWRLYTDEIARLTERKQFVQYGIRSSAVDEHARAIADIRALINTHGEQAAWLWDPYLSADDVLKTLFYSVHEGADLRALTAGKAVPVGKRKPLPQKNGLWMRLKNIFYKERPEKPSGPSWVKQQQDRIDAAKGNLEGLQLEFRIKKGQEGWAFHDRFLIFPRVGHGALAWSLGTSVNSLGHQHHILQKVADGQLVMDAFDDLWNALDKPSHVIWKTS